MKPKNILFRTFLLAGTAAVLISAAPGYAGTITTPGQTINSGDIAGGWKITLGQGISLIYDGVTTVNGGTLTIEKLIVIRQAPVNGVFEGLPITFTQLSDALGKATSGAPSTATFISIANETVTNFTGSPWTGFNFAVDGLTNQAYFTGSFAASDVAPFTTSSFVAGSNPTVIALGGGVFQSGDTRTWGSAAIPNNDLIIFANPSAVGQNAQICQFKEIPVVPLPAAALTGLSGLLGLPILGWFRRGRKARTA